MSIMLHAYFGLIREMGLQVLRTYNFFLALWGKSAQYDLISNKVTWGNVFCVYFHWIGTSLALGLSWSFKLSRSLSKPGGSPRQSYCGSSHWLQSPGLHRRSIHVASQNLHVHVLHNANCTTIKNAGPHKFTYQPHKSHAQKQMEAFKVVTIALYQGLSSPKNLTTYTPVQLEMHCTRTPHMLANH